MRLVVEVLARYEQPLMRLALRITGDVELARDVVQDTFIKLCHADRGRIEGHLAAWLFTVCRNRALDVRKKEARMGRLGDVDRVRDERSTGPQRQAAACEMLEMVEEALAGLTEQHREAFRLKFAEDLSYREIGKRMGKSLGTVSKLMAVSLGVVRERLRVGAALVEEVER